MALRNRHLPTVGNSVAKPTSKFISFPMNLGAGAQALQIGGLKKTEAEVGDMRMDWEGFSCSGDPSCSSLSGILFSAQVHSLNHAPEPPSPRPQCIRAVQLTRPRSNRVDHDCRRSALERIWHTQASQTDRAIAGKSGRFHSEICSETENFVTGRDPVIGQSKLFWKCFSLKSANFPASALMTCVGRTSRID